MIGTGRIQHQAIIVIGSICPCPNQAGEIHREHTVILFREIRKVVSAAVKITARRKPVLPGSCTLTPIGSHPIDISGLTGLVAAFI